MLHTLRVVTSRSTRLTMIGLLAAGLGSSGCGQDDPASKTSSAKTFTTPSTSTSTTATTATTEKTVERVTCKANPRKLPPSAQFTSLKPGSGVLVKVPSRDIEVRVFFEGATSLKQIQSSKRRPIALTADGDNRFVFVRVRIKNEGTKQVRMARVFGRFVARRNGAGYAAPKKCPAAAAYARERSRALPGESLGRAETRRTAMAFVVPKDGKVEWLVLGAGRKVDLTFAK